MAVIDAVSARAADDPVEADDVREQVVAANDEQIGDANGATTPAGPGGFPPAAHAEAPRQQPQESLTTAELERRAQHIFERFNDDGFGGRTSRTTDYSEIRDDLRGLTPADAQRLNEIYTQRYSAQRGGNDLITDVARELASPVDRMRAIGVLSPSRLHQLTPVAQDGRDPSIVSNRSAVIGVGTHVTARFDAGDYIASGPPTVRAFVLNDPAAVARGEVAPSVELGGSQAQMVARAEGTHRVVFEVTWGNQPPSYYEYNQTVRSPQSIASDNLARMPGTAPDPELYLTLVDRQIAATEQQIAGLRTQTDARSREQVGRLETLLGQLRETRDEAPGKLRGGAGAAIPMQAVLVPTETSQAIPLQVYAKPLGDNRWSIVDLTNPTDAREYAGARGATAEEGLRNAWNTFVADNNLPSGQIAARAPQLPPGYAGAAGVAPQLNFGDTTWRATNESGNGFTQWASGLGWFSLAAAVAGVGLMFVPGGQPFALGAFAIAGGAGAASGALSIADRVQHGNFELFSRDTALDMLSIVGGLAGAGGGVAGLVRGGAAVTSAATNGTNVTLRQLGNFTAISLGTERATDIASGVIIGTAYLQQIERIRNDPTLSDAQKQQQTQGVLQQAAMFGGIVVMGGGLGRNVSVNQIDDVMRRANFSPALTREVQQSPLLQNLLTRQGPQSVQDAFDAWRRATPAGQTFEQFTVAQRARANHTGDIARLNATARTATTLDEATIDWLTRHNFRFDEATGAWTKVTDTGKVLTAGVDGSNRWVVHNISDNRTINEYTLAPYRSRAANGSDGFFNAHHALQGEWGRARLGADINRNDGYYKDAPTINLRDTFAGSPHQTITARQQDPARVAGRATRTYLEERALTLADLRAAAVPANVIDQTMRQVDDYHRAIWQGMNATDRTRVFGDVQGQLGWR